MIKSILGMKLMSKELFDLLNGIQDGSVRFQVDGNSEEDIPVEESFDEMREREDNNYGED